MKKRKAITLRSIKQLWKRTGRRPVEVPLITQKMIDEVTAQPRQANPVPIRMPTAPEPTPVAAKPHHRPAWAAAAGAVLLIGAGIFWLARTAGDEERIPAAARAEPTANTERHQWQTAATPPPSQAEEHGNAGMVCYSGGRITDNCDEETVTTMLLAFL